jgi:hypothetical protein
LTVLLFPSILLLVLGETGYLEKEDAMPQGAYYTDLQAALAREVELLNEELGDKRPKPLAKSAPLTGDLARLVERTEFLEDLREHMQEDPELLRFVDSVIGQRVHASERRQTRLAIALGVFSLLAGWLLSLVGTPANLAQLLALWH